MPARRRDAVNGIGFFDRSIARKITRFEFASGIRSKSSLDFETRVTAARTPTIAPRKERHSALQLSILGEQLQAIILEYVAGLNVDRASVKPASNRRAWNLQFREEKAKPSSIGIACLANRLADPVVIATSGESCLHTMSYRHLDTPISRIDAESNLLRKSEALQLQQSSSRMSWNAAVQRLEV